MGAGAGAAAAIENEPSPRRAAIEKAQAELRREVAVREERRRELEFLEKGGELLDFFSAANFAFPPSSPTDPLADQLLSSEGEGGYASIASANGSSLENSVGTSFCVGKISEGGDDICPGEDLFNAVIEPLASWEGKGRTSRIGSTSLRSHNDFNLKRESEGSGGGRAGGKGQAYSRRNRPRTNRFGNGHTPTRDADRSLGGAAVNEIKGAPAPAPTVVPEEITEENETMVDKNVQVLPSPTLLNNSSTHAGTVSTKVNEDSECSHSPTGKAFEQTPVNQVSTADNAVETGKGVHGYEVAVGSWGTLPRSSDLKDHVCTEVVVKDDFELVDDLGKVNQTSLSPCLERNVDWIEGGAVSQPSEQVLDNNQEASEKACVLPNMVMDESAIVMVRDESLGSQTSKNECKDKSTVVAESKGDRLIDRSTVIPKHAPDSTLTPTIDDKTSVLREVSCTMQLTPKSLESSENKSNASRKTTSTASSGAPDLLRNDKAVIVDRPPGAQVEVKVEEGLSEVGTRFSAVDPQVESGHDVKRICVVSIPQEEIKTESQSTPVSAGSNRAGFRTPNSNTASINKFPGVVLPWEKERDPLVRAEAERHRADLSAKAKKAHEDYIIEEAEIIKVTRKEMVGWARRSPNPEPTKRKSHWDYVLQEMAWMANDFMQERLWKLASATQFSQWIAQQRAQFDFQNVEMKRRQKRVARVLADAVNGFWRLVESIVYKHRAMAFSLESLGQEISGPQKENEAVPMDVDIPATSEGSTQNLENRRPITRKPLPVQSYAIRFLRDAIGDDIATQAEAPSTPERFSEASSLLDPLWEDQFSEEPLFYTVPDGAFQAYRALIETERTSLEIEHEQNINDHVAALAEAEAQAVAEGAANSDFNVSLPVDESQPLSFLSPPMKGLRVEEDELRGQYMPNAISSIAKKKRKNILKSNALKGEGLPSSGPPQRPSNVPSLDSSGGIPSALVTGKRSLSAGPGIVVGNVGSIPTKRMRSAPTARQRVLGTASPSSFPSPGGALQRTTFSSGALNSNQDEVRSLDEDTVTARSEVDASPAGVKNGLGFGCTNSFVSSKSKKKKKTKHFSGPLISGVKGEGIPSVNTASSLKPPESEHRGMSDQLKRKSDQVHTGSVEPDAGGIGSSADTPETPSSQGQQPAKKPKVSKQASELNPEAAAAAVSTGATQAGSVVANTSSTSKLLRQNSNRDRNRKTKSAKVPVSQPAGIGIPWTTIEDQAIFALIHDLGHNYELVSDVLSSSSQLKGIFRKPKQCKERHKALMDRMSVGDGGDSPEDPSTSQPHPSSLPGIPKGAARLVLQRIQGPMEEDTLKVHLESIVRVVQKFPSLKPQNEEQKLLVQPHASHLATITQISPNGYPTPLELCEITAVTPELGGPTYPIQASHLPGVLAAGSGIRPATNGLPVLSATNNLHIGVPAVAPSTAAANAARDVHRLAAVRPFSPEDVQRVRYHRAIVAARSLPVPGTPATAGLPMMGLPSPSDCPVPLLGPGNNVGMIGGMSRGMSLSRPGLPGMGSPGIGPPSLGNVLPQGGVGIVSAGPTVGPTGVPQQVSLVRRSRDQLVRPGRSSEDQRRFIEDLKHQAAQGSSQAATALSSLGSEMTREMLAVQGQPFQQLQHQAHQQQQQYLAATRMTKERHQMQQKQRMLQQQLPQPTSLQPQLQTQIQQHQLHAMSPQHVLPQPSHLSQQQHLLPTQQHNLQKQQSQQGPQQTGTLSSPPLQPTTVPSMQSNHQPQQHQTLLQPQQQSSLGQVPQLPVQPKLQPPKQPQKHPHLRQASQVVQQQPPRGSKGVVRGNMLVQAVPGSGQSSMLPGNVPAGNQPQQLAGQQISHSIQGPRHLMPLAKPLSQTSTQLMTGQSGIVQTQQNLNMAGSVPQSSLGGQQKVVSQQQSQIGTLSSQLQPSPSPNALPSQQQQSPTPGLSGQQQQTSPSVQQLQIGPSQQMQPQQRRQAQQQAQMQSSQRRIQLRQPGASGGGPMIGQLGKSGSSQQSQVPAQLSSQTGHVTYPQGTNIAVPMSMMGASSGASGLSSSGSPSSTGVHSTQWKSGQSVSPMTAGFYNLTRSGSPGSAQLPSIVSSSGMHLASSNGNSGMSTSSSGPHGVSVSGLPQSLQVGSSGHGSKIGLIPVATSRGVSPTLQAGLQRSVQHHGSLPTSSGIGATQQVRSPVPATSAGMMPVSALGTTMVGGVLSSGSMSYQANSGSIPSHSTAISNSMHMFAVQPRQSHAGSAALTTPAVPLKSPPGSGISQTSASSASSPAPVIPPSTTASTSVAEPTPP